MATFNHINFIIAILMQLLHIIKYSFLKISICMLSFILLTNSITADETDTLFHSDEIINMELRSDFSAIQVDRVDNPQYHDGELIYYTPNGDTVNLSVEVMARGNFRRDPANCKFPPLFVNFSKGSVKNTLFYNHERLKLVTPCQNDEDVIEEYMIYKMYNQITDISFKVRLVKILYFDTGAGKEVFNKYSFFIEEKSHIEKRTNTFEKDVPLTPFDLDQEYFKKMSVFEYLIGNKEWFITTRHNVVIMQPNDTSLAPYAVPYDFDFSAFVNANYTKPKGVPEELLSNRREFKGICYTSSEFNEIFDFYRELRPEFESIINNMELISKSSRNQILRYLREFYIVVARSDLIKRDFLDMCETKKDYNIPE
jgi:hypothetical protein